MSDTWSKILIPKEHGGNVLSMKFMMANEGPMLSTNLKVSKSICPWLKAMIVKAYGQ